MERQGFVYDQNRGEVIVTESGLQIPRKAQQYLRRETLSFLLANLAEPPTHPRSSFYGKSESSKDTPGIVAEKPDQTTEEAA